MVTDKLVACRGSSKISKLRKLSNFRKIIVRSTYYRLHVEPLWIFALFGVLLFRQFPNSNIETSTVRSSSNEKYNKTITKTNTSNKNSNSITRKKAYRRRNTATSNYSKQGQNKDIHILTETKSPPNRRPNPT